MRTLVVGGARSGKSGFAESLFPAECTYVATARPWRGEFDADFTQRIARHRQRRPAHWKLEDQRDLVEVLRAAPPTPLLIDDLGTWLSARIDAADAWDAPQRLAMEIQHELVEALCQVPEVVLVSPEVGMGIIPAHPAGRHFRDALGSLNAAVAEVCDAVYLVVAGQPLAVKTPEAH